MDFQIMYTDSINKAALLVLFGLCGVIKPNICLQLDSVNGNGDLIFSCYKLSMTLRRYLSLLYDLSKFSPVTCTRKECVSLYTLNFLSCFSQKGMKPF